MFCKSKLISMDRDHKYASSSWIKNINTLNDNQEYKLYATNKSSISSGREYIALPVNKILTKEDYINYDIMK